MVDDIDFLIRFPEFEQPLIKNYKHVRKLMLSVEGSDRKLVSNGTSVIGIATGEIPKCRITADYRGGYGFHRLAGKPVCSFSDGSFHSSTRRPNLVQLEEILIESRIDPAITHVLFKIVTAIVNKSRERRHGCSIIIGLNSPCARISGQKLDRPIDLSRAEYLDLAQSLAKVDGALHIGADLHLHSFACLLDGSSVPQEDSARGARFNSALRFTAKHENIIVVVVSSDRPVSVMQRGVELTARCEWRPFSESISMPPTLEEWIEAGE